MSLVKAIDTDVLVIGGGMAGFFAALKAKEQGLDVTLADKNYVGKTGATHFAPGDLLYFLPERGHNLKEMVKVMNERCEYIINQDWEEICLTEMRDRNNDLIAWGIPFEHKNGKLHVINPYGKNAPAMYENVHLIHRQYAPALRQRAIENGVRILDKVMFCELLKQDGRVAGAIGLHTISGNLHIVHAKAVIVATGSSTLKAGNYPIMFWTGDGEAMAYRAGADIAGEEFALAETTRYLRRDVNRVKQLASEKGSSGEVIDAVARYPFAVGHDYVGWFSPNLNAEGGPVFSPSWEAHCGRAPLFLDMSIAFEVWPQEQREFLQEDFRRCGTAQPDKIGVDILRGGKIQWPASRIMTMSIFCGTGIFPVDTTCATAVPGLYAAGNSCATMVSGARYAGMGFALNHAMVTGARAGLAATEYASKTSKTRINDVELAKVKSAVSAPVQRKGGFSPGWVTQVVQGITVPYFFLNIKHGERLQAALTIIEFVNSHLVPRLMAKDAHEWRLAQETRNMALIAEMRLRASLFRTESRGFHFRQDYPRRDDPAWLAWVKIKEEQGKMTLSKEPVPEKWWPDLSRPYEERYPILLPNEVPGTSDEPCGLNLTHS